jgi:SAM-dependent methyltransferase
MSKLFLLDATDPINQDALSELEQKLFKFYNSEKVREYWIKTDVSNDVWEPATHPYHLHLKSYIKPGASVIELGCGSANAYKNLRQLNIQYTGIEWAENQVQLNAINYPDADFISASVYDIPLPDESFDVAISFFTLEHAVYPDRYLNEMYRLIKPGGIIAIICPDFRGSGGMNSFVYGTSSLELREKLKMGRLWDVLLHLYERKFAFPRKITQEYGVKIKNKRFLIYPNPKCIDGKWYSDTDAVYFAGQEEIQGFLETMNCQILAQPSNVDDDMFSFCYVVAKKGVCQ